MMTDTVYLPKLSYLRYEPSRSKKAWEELIFPIPVEFIETELFCIEAQNSLACQELLQQHEREDLIRPIITKFWQYRLIHNAPGEEM